MENVLINSLKYHYGIDVTSLFLKREGGSKSFEVRCGNENYFLKLIPKAFSKTIRQSLDILDYLKENGFSSPKIIRTEDDKRFFDFYEGKIGVLYRYIDGEEVDIVDDFSEIGKLVGNLHSLMKKYPLELVDQDKFYFVGRYIDQLQQKNYDEDKLKVFKELGNYLWDKVKDVPRGFCHGDLHLGNLLKTKKNKYYILDFDTSCCAFPMYDIMILCNCTDYFNYDEQGFFKTKEAYKSFLKGYLKYCELTPNEKESFYYFIAIYHFQIQATILEIHGLDCIDNNFIDNQLEWLLRWRKQCLDNN